MNNLELLKINKFSFRINTSNGLSLLRHASNFLKLFCLKECKHCRRKEMKQNGELRESQLYEYIGIIFKLKTGNI